MISLLVPTRGRPANVARFLNSAAATARTPQAIEAVFYVDDDDPTRDDVAEVVRRSGGALAKKVLVGPRKLSVRADHAPASCITPTEAARMPARTTVASSLLMPSPRA
jgi:hypothetical protein